MMATKIGVELTLPVSSDAEVFLKKLDSWMSRCQMKERIEFVKDGNARFVDKKEKKFSTSLFKGSLKVCPKDRMGDDSEVKKMRFVWKAGFASLVMKEFHERMTRKCKKMQTLDEAVSEHDSMTKTALACVLKEMTSLEREAFGEFAPKYLLNGVKELFDKVEVQEYEEQTIKMMQVQLPCESFACQTVSVGEIDLSQIGAKYECMEVESESDEDDDFCKVECKLEVNGIQD